jgi:hypothetical protein
MSKRSNHYEAAFEAYLRELRAPYIAIDESRRSLIPFDVPSDAVGSLKSLDFLVTSSQGFTWLVDVKGRHFPSGKQGRLWKNWATRDDVACMGRWENLLGGRFQSLFVFAYNVTGDVSPLPAERLFAHREGRYAFLGVRLAHFAEHAKLISPKWETLAMPSAALRQWAQPMDELL